MAFISVKNLKYRYPNAEKLALDGISLEIERGEFIGILGENGAGKSTLSQALLGLIPQFYKGAYGGEVLLDGENAATTAVGELCKKAGLIFQNPFNQLSGAKDTVFDEVAYGLQNLGVEREEIFRRVEETLRTLDIWEYRDRNPFDLSGGQLQRVAIASILAMRPQLLILDEPTSQLDPAGSEEVFQTVEKLKKTGITILMIEQKIEKLAQYSDRILLLHQGKQIDMDTPEKIFSREDLAQYGVAAPFAVRFSKAQGLRCPDGSYPLDSETLLSLVSDKRRGEIREALRTALREDMVTVPFEAEEEKADSAPLRPGEDNADPALKTGNAEGAQEPRAHVFTVQDLHFSYRKGTPILKGLNLELDHRPTAIVGQNGAGKTTLVRLIKGLLKPDSGALLFRGEDISKKTVAELAGEVGYVFQNPDDQIFKSNVLDEVLFGPLNIGMDRESAEEKAREALRLVGLEGREQDNPYDLELSDRKMIAIASVLAMDTDVLILDEPTIAQDERGKRILAGIIEAASARGKLVIAILHDMEFVLHSFSRVIVMAKGEILASADPLTVFQTPEALQRAALLPPTEVQLLTALA